MLSKFAIPNKKTIYISKIPIHFVQIIFTAHREDLISEVCLLLVAKPVKNKKMSTLTPTVPTYSTHQITKYKTFHTAYIFGLDLSMGDFRRSIPFLICINMVSWANENSGDTGAGPFCLVIGI